MQATIYIRKGNEEAWNAIEDKSAWVNGNLEAKDDTIIFKDLKPPQEKHVNYLKKK